MAGRPGASPAGLRISGVGDAAAVAEDEGNDTAPGPSPAATAPAPADDEFVALARRDSEPALDTYTPFSGLPPSVAESAPVTANNSPRLNGINPRLTGGANGHRSAAAPVSTRQTKAALAPEILITKMVAKGAARIVTRQVGSAKEQVVGLATAAKKTTYDTIVAGPALIAGWAINMGWGVLKSLASPFLPPGNKGAPVDAAALGAAVAEVAAAVERAAQLASAAADWRRRARRARCHVALGGRRARRAHCLPRRRGQPPRRSVDARLPGARQRALAADVGDPRVIAARVARRDGPRVAPRRRLGQPTLEGPHLGHDPLALVGGL